MLISKHTTARGMGLPYVGGGGVRGCAARQGVRFEDMRTLRVYFFANFLVCVLSGMHFNLIVSYVLTQVYNLTLFDRILCSLRVEFTYFWPSPPPPPHSTHTHTHTHTQLLHPA